VTTTETEPYISREPGDLITAGDWNGVQVEIREDIRKSIDKAKEEVKHEGVDTAKNADEFAGMSEKELTDKLDQRYAPRVHDHEGQSAYRRYIKEFTTDPGLDSVLLKHELGRFPLVDTYELLAVAPQDGGTGDCKLLFYYGHADAERLGLWIRTGRERVPLGLPFEQVLTELGIEYEDDDTIEDVLNDLWNGFMKDPNDEIKHCTTEWVDECCGERRTVADLKRADQWNDLYLALRPRKCGKGADDDVVQVEIAQVNYDTIFVTIDAAYLSENSPLDLMFLLRS
jgi:hypothetical protein